MTKTIMKPEREQLHMRKIVELLNGKNNINWLDEYVEFHIKLYGLKKSKRIARSLGAEFPMAWEFSKRVAGR